MSIKFRAIIARQCLFRFRLLVFLENLVLFQHLPDQGGLVERNIVDDRALRYATLSLVPSSASDFRVWKNQLLLIMANVDISDRDYLAHWLSKTFEVNSDEVIKHDLGCVPP